MGRTHRLFGDNGRVARPVIIAGALLVLWFLLMGWFSLPVAADAAIIFVPDDYPTIQAAIDAAQEGDEIRITGDRFKEALRVSKSITLSGGWNEVFTGTSPYYTAVDPQGLERAITISGTHAGVVVAISGFAVINGDATGQGGVEIEAIAASAVAAPADAAGADDDNPPEFAQRARVQLHELAVRGLLPGGQAALPAVLERLDRLLAMANAAPTTPAATAVQGAADCGGGIYVRGAGLYLRDSVIGTLTDPNVASRNGLGAGGALCAVDIPAAGLVLEQVQLENNTASVAGAGLGGAVFVSTTVEGAVRFANFRFLNNVAGRGGDGYGGGVVLFNAPGAALENGSFQNNLASAAGPAGYGGGLANLASPRTRLTNVGFMANSANVAWSPVNMGLAVGFGGGIYVLGSDNVTIGDGTLVQDNQAMLHGAGSGGGLFVDGGQGLRVLGAEFVGNWSVIYPYQLEGGQSMGGGIALSGVHNAQIQTTTLHENNVTLFNGGCLDIYGGALAGVGLEDFQLTGSQISANTGGACGGEEESVSAGAVSLISKSRAMTITGNTFADNVTELDGQIGRGGALYLYDASDVMVSQNEFLRNIGGARRGIGGAVVMEGSAGVRLDSNRFVGNQAAGVAGAEYAIGGALAVRDSIDLQIVNNLLVGNAANQGAGMLLVGNTASNTATVAIANNTLYANVGGSGVNLRLWTTPITLTNNVIVSHTVGIEVESGTAAASYTLYNANAVNAGGEGVLDESQVVTAPVDFVAPGAGDFHLTMTSAARDAGDPAGVPPAPPVDIEGSARPFGRAVDIGAYELHGPQVYLPLIERAPAQRTGWAIGWDEHETAVILHTVDGGAHWTVQGDKTQWPGHVGNDISAVDTQTAWAALAESTTDPGGKILHTTDGGVTWVVQTLPASVQDQIKGIKGLSRQVAWASSLRGIILHTVDGGQQWTVVPNPTTPMTQVNRMDASGSQDVWIADQASGADGVVHTLDNGLTWRREHLPDVAPGSNGAFVINAVSPSQVWATVNAQCDFYRTVDGGITWARAVPGAVCDQDYDDICAAGADDVWAVLNLSGGSGGTIYRVHLNSTGDITKQTFDPVNGYQYEGITCLDEQTAWVVGWKGFGVPADQPTGIILHTTDGGAHWARQSLPVTDVKLWKVSFVGARR